MTNGAVIDGCSGNGKTLCWLIVNSDYNSCDNWWWCYSVVDDVCCWWHVVDNIGRQQQ